MNKHHSESPRNTTVAAFLGFGPITFFVSNAKQAAYYFRAAMGFKEVAYKGLETGSKCLAEHAVSNGQVCFVFVSPVINASTFLLDASDNSNEENAELEEEKELAKEANRHVSVHGDSVRDIGLEVVGIRNVLDRAVKQGVRVVQEVTELEDESGKAWVATVHGYGDVSHTLIEKDKHYKGSVLPGYNAPEEHQDQFEDLLPPVEFVAIDHIVSNHFKGQMEAVGDRYSNAFAFDKFWSVDESVVCTEYSALNSIVMASPNNRIKLPINEPAVGKKPSQIDEFLAFHDGPGVQHIALLTGDIITAVENMRARGVDFIDVPPAYYETMRARLALRAQTATPLTPVLKESFDLLEKNRILVDFDDQGYLLQIFTKPHQDRPTLFFEIIQREGHDGFGAGNFRALFEAIELEQRKRGNL